MFNKRKISKLSSNSEYILKSYDRKNKITKTYYFNPDKFTLKKQSFESKKGEILTVNYENYKKFESNNVRQLVTITAKNNDKSIKFEMKTKVSRINERISFHSLDYPKNLAKKSILCFYNIEQVLSEYPERMMAFLQNFSIHFHCLYLS